MRNETAYALLDKVKEYGEHYPADKQVDWSKFSERFLGTAGFIHYYFARYPDLREQCERHFREARKADSLKFQEDSPRSE